VTQNGSAEVPDWPLPSPLRDWASYHPGHARISEERVSKFPLNLRAKERGEAGFLQTIGPAIIGPSGGRIDLVPERKVIPGTTIRVTKAEALPVKKPKKPKVKSSSAIQKKSNRKLSPLPQEPIQNPAKSLQQTNTAEQHPQDQQMKNPPKRWSLMKRAVGVVVAVVSLIASKRPKGP
jgi:hypothetical protein